MNNFPGERSTAETFTGYAKIIWHWSWLLVLCVVISGGIAYWVSIRLIPVYQVTTTVMVDAAPLTQTVTNTSLTASQQLAATYAKVMVMQPILDGVAKRLDLAIFPLSATVQAQTITGTQLLEVIVQDTDPTRAAMLANTLVEVFSEKIKTDQASRYADSKRGLETQLINLEQQIRTTEEDMADLGSGATDQSRQAQLQVSLTQYRLSYASVLQSYEQLQLAEAQSSSGINQQNPAVPSDIPIRPRPVLYALLSALSGLIIAIAVVSLVELLDDTIRDPHEIMQKWGIPVLATIVRYNHDKNDLITAQQPRSQITETFRALRTNLQYASVNLPIHTLLVTSPSPEDGKTTIATNLACVIAQGGRKVVIVDADMRRPRLHRVFQIPNRIGLTDQFIRPYNNIIEEVNQTEIAGLHVITSGNLPPNPSEILSSERMSEILHQLAGQFDMVVIDAPPFLLVTDALVLAPRVDGVLVVIKPSVTKRAALKNLVEQLRQVKANVIGVVLNDVKINRSRYYNYHGYYYNQKYSKGYRFTESSDESENANNHDSPKMDLGKNQDDTRAE
jgi:polysaccharide biosynthesis transport protein